MLVHGPLTLVLILSLLRSQLKKDEMVSSFHYRNLAPLYVNETMKVCGRRRPDGRFVMWIEDSRGSLAVKGDASVAIMSNEDPTDEDMHSAVEDGIPLDTTTSEGKKGECIRLRMAIDKHHRLRESLKRDISEALIPARRISADRRNMHTMRTITNAATIPVDIGRDKSKDGSRRALRIVKYESTKGVQFVNAAATPVDKEENQPGDVPGRAMRTIRYNSTREEDRPGAATVPIDTRGDKPADGSPKAFRIVKFKSARGGRARAKELHYKLQDLQSENHTPMDQIPMHQTPSNQIPTNQILKEQKDIDAAIPETSSNTIPTDVRENRVEAGEQSDLRVVRYFRTVGAKGVDREKAKAKHYKLRGLQSENNILVGPVSGNKRVEPHKNLPTELMETKTRRIPTLCKDGPVHDNRHRKPTTVLAETKIRRTLSLSPDTRVQLFKLSDAEKRKIQRLFSQGQERMDRLVQKVRETLMKGKKTKFLSSSKPTAGRTPKVPIMMKRRYEARRKSIKERRDVIRYHQSYHRSRAFPTFRYQIGALRVHRYTRGTNRTQNPISKVTGPSDWKGEFREQLAEDRRKAVAERRKSRALSVHPMGRPNWKGDYHRMLYAAKTTRQNPLRARKRAKTEEAGVEEERKENLKLVDELFGLIESPKK